MKKSLATLCLILWMVVPVASLAADALVNFVPNQCPANTGPANAPQGTAAPNNQMKLIVKARDVGNNPMPQLKTVDVGQILLESCDIPSYVAKKSQDAICA